MDSSVPFIDEYLPEDATTARNTCITEVCTTLEVVLIKYIQTIKESINVDDLPTADEKLDLINRVKSIMGTYCSLKVIQEIDEVDKMHSIALGKLIESYKTKKIEDYIVSSLGELLDRFTDKKSSKNIASYQKAAQTITEHVIKTFKSAIEQLKMSTDEDEREERKRELKYAISTLPDRMKNPLKTNLKSCTKFINNKQSKEIAKIDEAISTGDTLKIQNNLQEYTTKKGNYLPILIDKLEKQVTKIADAAAAHLKANCLDQCVEVVRYQLLGYLTINNNSKPIANLGSVQQLKFALLNKFNSTAKLLKEIENREKVDSFEKATLDWIILVKALFPLNSVNLNDFLTIDNLVVTVSEVNKSVANFFNKLLSKYEEKLNVLDILGLKQCISDIAKWEQVFKYFGEYVSFCKTVAIEIDGELFINNQELLLDKRNKISEKLKEVKDNLLNITLLNEKTKQIDKMKSEFYEWLNANLSIARNVASAPLIVNDEIINCNTFEKECVDSIAKKIETELSEKGKALVAKPNWNKMDKKDIDLITKNLGIISSTIENGTLNQAARDGYNKIKEQVEKKLDRNKQDINNDPKHIESVAHNLKQMKDLIDVVPVMKETINEAVDDALDKFKKDTETLKKTQTRAPRRSKRGRSVKT